MLEICGRVNYSFCKNNESVAKAKSGDEIVFSTLDCFANQLKPKDAVLDSLDWNRVNPATGPLYIDDAKVGDILKVEIKNIEIENFGVMVAGEKLGTLGHLLKGVTTKKIEIKNGKAIFNEKLELPLNVMIGVIGVAPEKDENIKNGVPGSHGGNMDNKMIAVGSTLYLPIFHDGALLSMGDLHAVMGDGEICVTGLEIDGKVTVKVEVIKSKSISNPMLENSEVVSTIASHVELDKAVDIATEDMFKFLKDRLDIPKNEIAMLMSAVGNAEICQIVDPLKTARFTFPKWVLKKYSKEVF